MQRIKALIVMLAVTGCGNYGEKTVEEIVQTAGDGKLKAGDSVAFAGEVYEIIGNGVVIRPVNGVGIIAEGAAGIGIEKFKSYHFECKVKNYTINDKLKVVNVDNCSVRK